MVSDPFHFVSKTRFYFIDNYKKNGIYCNGTTLFYSIRLSADADNEEQFYFYCNLPHI